MFIGRNSSGLQAYSLQFGQVDKLNSFVYGDITALNDASNTLDLFKVGLTSTQMKASLYGGVADPGNATDFTSLGPC